MNVITETSSTYASPFRARYDNFIGGAFVAPRGPGATSTT